MVVSSRGTPAKIKVLYIQIIVLISEDIIYEITTYEEEHLKQRV